jgi:hypothetical protein
MALMGHSFILLRTDRMVRMEPRERLEETECAELTTTARREGPVVMAATDNPGRAAFPVKRVIQV